MRYDFKKLYLSLTAMGLALFVSSSCSDTPTPAPPKVKTECSAEGEGEGEGEEETKKGEEEEETELRLRKASLSLKADPTYDDRISTIIDGKCGACHGEKSKDGDYSTYANVKKNAAKIVAAIKKDKEEDGFMPKGGKALAEKDIADIEAWIKAKHPEGKKEEAPEGEEDGEEEEKDEKEGARSATSGAKKCS